MAIEGEIITYLKTQTDLTDLVGTRIYPFKAPQNPTYPYIVMKNPSNPRIPVELGIEGENPVLSFLTVAKTGASMVNISSVLATILKYKSVSLATLYLYFCTPVGARDLSDDPAMEDDYFVKADDYQFEYQDLS